jgi:hypothetical protein
MFLKILKISLATILISGFYANSNEVFIESEPAPTPQANISCDEILANNEVEVAIADSKDVESISCTEKLVNDEENGEPEIVLEQVNVGEKTVTLPKISQPTPAFQDDAVQDLAYQFKKFGSSIEKIRKTISAAKDRIKSMR